MVYRQRDDGYAVLFFQGEDGIRDLTVTGVQTCALPIFVRTRDREPVAVADGAAERTVGGRGWSSERAADAVGERRGSDRERSEERRVGKECRSRWSTDH